ncbi:MAG: FAD/NAD(P)-binding protein [Kiritimatiellia bacterium]
MMAEACNPEHDIYKPELAVIAKSEQMTELERFFAFEMLSGSELGHKPGQFAEVSVAGIGEAPISISSSPTQSGGFEMVIRNVGNVSGALHRMKEGSRVGIRGPYGVGFPVDTELKGRDLLFICGGIGLVPVRSAINYVLDNRGDYGKVTILFGAKTPAERLFTGELETWDKADDVDFRETVDAAGEKWEGNTGVITTLIPDLDIDVNTSSVVVCGPPVMYKFVMLELEKKKIPFENVYLSLERRMKCGVGKCGHCQINGLYVCKDGPVFRYSDIREVREAI